MKRALQELVFPLSWEQGGSIGGINSQRMRQMAQNSRVVGRDDFEKMVKEHHRFLREGGAGGAWQTLLLGGLVVAMYQKAMKTDAQQFSLEYRRLGSGLEFVGLPLPFINCCGAFLPKLKATASVLPHSLFTDSFLKAANFSKAQLQGVDFSRADLRSVNFSKADLSEADFENCDLRGADFRGARIVGARFPGARLEGVLS